MTDGEPVAAERRTRRRGVIPALGEGRRFLQTIKTNVPSAADVDERHLDFSQELSEGKRDIYDE